MNEVLKKRLSSLLWRAGGQVVAILLSGLLALTTDGVISLPPLLIIFIGLVIGEITKWLNSPVEVN